MNLEEIICKGKQEDFINYGSWMAGLAGSQDLRRRDSDEEIEPIQEFDLEDPARSWVDLVEAYKSADPSAVRTMMTDAKNSNWSHALLDDLEADMGLKDLKQVQDQLHSKEEMARTKVTARQNVYCPFCGVWFDALEFIKHTC